MKAAERLIDVAAAVSDGCVVDWGRAESESGEAERHLVGHLRVIEQIASVHAGLPPVAAFERSLHDSLLNETATAAPEPAETPARWGPLTIVEKIGSGTYADVYRARDPRLDRPVALKLLRHREAGAALESEAIEEARLLARIHHPNVVTVYGAERIDGRVGIWMEFVDGRTLEQELRDRGPLPADELVAIGSAICRALGAVHGAGLLHRDVKAQNVMRASDGRVLLADFGTGREVTQVGAARELAGTPLYLAPEVLKGDAASVASDVYSLGVLLYHLASGAFPVSGRSLRDLVDAHARGAHVPLDEARPDLPSRVTSAIDRATALDVGQRYESTVALETALAGAISPRMVWRRARLAATVAAAGLVTFLVFEATWGAVGGSRVSPKTFTSTQLTFNSAELPTTAAAISPDGKYLACLDAAGLTVRTLATGPDLRLPLQPGMEISNLAWLPDSVGLLMAGPSGVWRTSAFADTPRRIGGDRGMVSVSPDGLHMALTIGGLRIRVMTMDGENAVDVVSPAPGVNVGRAMWSPDGQRIAYYIQRRDPTGEHQRPAIETRRLDGGETTVLVSGAPFGGGGMAWASDGRILFTRSLPAPKNRYGNLWEIRVDAATGQPVGDPAPVYEPPDFNFLMPSLTANAKRLVFLVNRYRINVYTAEFDQTRAELMGLRPAVSADTENSPSSWMPQGDAILFQTPASASRKSIYRQDLNRGEPQLLVGRPNIDIAQAVVSPDSNWIFYLPAQARVVQVMRVPAAGGTSEPLFGVPPASWLRCSRASANICVVGSLTGDGLQLTLFDPALGKPGRQVTLPKSPSEDSWDLSPDGTEVVSLDSTGPVRRAVLLDLQSQKVQTLKSDAWATADSVAWSANERGWIVTGPVGQRGSKVLYIDRNGHSKTLWESAFQQLSLPMVSPNGGRIAFGSLIMESSVWMLRGF